MSELPTREPRSPREQIADARAMEGYFASSENLGSIKHILEGDKWVPIIPGDRDYKRALPDRFDRETGMPISPGDSTYEKAAKKLPKRFR